MNTILEDRSLAYEKPSFLMPIIVCIMASTFCLYEFILQVSPGVMTTSLMREFQLNAAGLGTLSGAYYYTYAPMQMIAGLLYDRFAPRRMMTMAIAFCALGALVFGVTQSLAWASTARLLMGMGSAFAFLGGLLLITRWFPTHLFALMTGVIQFMCSLGAIVGEAPLAAIVSYYGWRQTFLGMAIAGFLLAAFVYLFVRDQPPGFKTNEKIIKPGEIKRLLLICANKQSWFVALVSFFIWAPILALSLWGLPFFQKAYNLSTYHASLLCSMMWLGFGVSGPLIGWFSDRIKRRCLPLTIAASIGFAATFALIYWNLPYTALVLLMTLVGAAGSSISLAYSLVRDNNPIDRVGTALGFNNTAACAGGILFQPLVGYILNMTAPGLMQNGVPVYNLSNYHLALAVVPACFLITGLLSRYWINETNCKLYGEQYGAIEQ